MTTHRRNPKANLGDTLYFKVSSAYARNLERRKRGLPILVVDVTLVTPISYIVKIEEDNPQGNRICFEMFGVTICSKSKAGLDLAERLLSQPAWQNYIINRENRELEKFNTPLKERYAKYHHDEEIEEPIED